jgi:hypothetical protein
LWFFNIQNGKCDPFLKEQTAIYGEVAVSDIYLFSKNEFFVATEGSGLLTVSKQKGKYNVYQSKKDIFQKNALQYDEIKMQVELKSGKNVRIASEMYGFISEEFAILGGEHSYNEENLMAKITNKIENKNYLENCFYINSQINDGLEVVRFRLPEGCSFTRENFKSEYFEVNKSDFLKILSQ